MVRITLFLLIFVFGLEAWCGELRVCVINSYTIPPAKEVEASVKEALKQEGYAVVDEGCDIKVVLGTPALAEELKRGEFKKLVFTFVLFPEELLERYKRDNVYGVRIFPLPERTVKSFLKGKKRRRVKVAVPVSREMLSIARVYLPKRYFKILTFEHSPAEVFSKLTRYKYVYIFPDPKLLKVVNLLRLIGFGKESGIEFLTGLGDLKRYGVDYTQQVSYKGLVRSLVEAVKGKPKKKILPCPVEGCE